MTAMPLHPDHASYCRDLADLKYINSRIADLQARRTTILESLPFGYFMIDGERYVIREQRSTRISINSLKRYVSPHVIEMCRVYGNRRKSLIKAPLKQKPE